MAIRILSLLCFIVFLHSSMAQNKSFAIRDDYYRLNKRKMTSDERNFLCVIDSGRICYFNGRQPFLLLRDFRTLITFDSVYRYYSLDASDEKGSFAKDGTTKIMYGKPAERYSLFSPLLDVHLWVSQGDRKESILSEVLDNLGLLKNIPQGKTIVAVEYNGIENDLGEIKYFNDNRRTKSYLYPILNPKREDTATTNCYERSMGNEKLDIQDLRDTLVTFMFKTTSVTTYFDGDGDHLETQTSTQYFNENDDEMLNISKMTNQDGVDYNAYYTRQFNGQYIFGEVKGDRFIIKKAETMHYNLCDALYPLKPAGIDTLKDGSIIHHYLRFYKNKFSILKYSYDISPAYRNVENNAIIKDLPNGIIREARRIYASMDAYVNKLESIETGKFTFKLEK